MATLAAMIADVYTLTNRPDLVGETTLAVKAATLKAHQSDYFPKDLFETGIVFNTEDFFQQLDYKSLIPLWRSAKYLRLYDNVGQTAGLEFKLVVPESVIDDYKVDKDDIYYLAGSTINIRCKISFQYLLLGCYLNPDITDAGYNSWISDEHPYAISFEAARVVFKTIGYDEQSSAYEKLVAEQYAELKTSQILANGY